MSDWLGFLLAQYTKGMWDFLVLKNLKLFLLKLYFYLFLGSAYSLSPTSIIFKVEATLYLRGGLWNTSSLLFSGLKSCSVLQLSRHEEKMVFIYNYFIFPTLFKNFYEEINTTLITLSSPSWLAPSVSSPNLYSTFDSPWRFIHRFFLLEQLSSWLTLLCFYLHPSARACSAKTWGRELLLVQCQYF